MNNEHYQEITIKNSISELNMLIGEMYKMQIELDFCEHHFIQEVSEEIDRLKFKFNQKTQDIYLIIIAYLEIKKNNTLLELFKANLNHIFNSDYNSLQSIYDDDGEEHFYSPDLEKIKRFLKAYRAFDNNKNQDIGLVFLENILKNTAVILKELKIKPNSEAEVYNGVKHVISSTFPDYIGLTESFYKEAKHYKPDILIPYIHTAIEYKFARNNQRLTKTIEEILIDVQGYSNHHLYKTFYAVFYVSPGITTDTRFKKIWDGYKFPSNWIPILVFGE